MVLSENMKAVRILIETMLRRNYHGETYVQQDIQYGLKLLNAVLPEGQIFVISDCERFSRHFAQAIRRPFRHIGDIGYLQGLENIHIVILHTGSGTPRQREIRDNLYAYMHTMRGLTVWHVGEWA